MPDVELVRKGDAELDVEGVEKQLENEIVTSTKRE